MGDGLSAVSQTRSIRFRDTVLPEGFQVGRQGVPLLDFVTVFVIEDAVVEIRHGRAVGHFGLQRQQAHGLGFHRAQHLGGVHPGNHPVELAVFNLRRGAALGAVGKGGGIQPGVRHPVEKHPIGVKVVFHAADIKLCHRHDGGNGGVHLRHGLQFFSGEIYPHQRKAGSAVGSHAHGQYVKGLGGRQASGPQGRPEDAVRRHADRRRVECVCLQVFHRP